MPQRAPHQSDRLDEQVQVLLREAKLPTSPAVAREVLRLTGNEYSSAQQFARLIEADPALAARLLHVANSAAYAQRSQVTTIQRAVTVMGLRQLRAVALGFELVDRPDRLGDRPFDLHRFWRDATRRACMARSVAARVVPPLAEEAFLAGLLQECGVLPLVQGLGHEYAVLYRARAVDPGAFHAAERRRFSCTHVDALAALAETWRFPATITEALVGHHRPIRLGSRSPDEARLRGVCALVGMVGADVDPSEACRAPAVRRYARRELRLDGDELSSCAADAVRSAAEITPLTDPAGSAEIDAAHLLVMAKRHLEHHALEMEQRLQVLEAEHGRVLDEQQVLRAALGQYREQAARDPLTGLLNRRALRDAAQSCLEHSQQQGRNITVMFLDIDDFKQLNDRHGHSVGDEVLQAVARRLLTLVEPWGDVGRYGGEEFVVVAAGLTEPEARSRAAEVLVAVRRAGRDVPAVPRAVTGSLGIVWAPCGRGRSAPALFAAADERMYRAKCNGKDRCCFARLAGAGDARAMWPASRGGVPIVPAR